MSEHSIQEPIEVTLQAPTDVVRDWFTEPDQLRQWFGWEAPGLDDEIATIFDPGKVVTGPGETVAEGRLV